MHDKVMKKRSTYKKPTIKEINISQCFMLTSSAHSCTDSCKYWHICRDREYGKKCEDFKYKL